MRTKNDVTCDLCAKKKTTEDVDEEEKKLAEEISRAEDDTIIEVFNKLNTMKHIHSAHYIQVKLYMR